MFGPHPIRRLAVLSLLGSAIFAGFVAGLWHTEDSVEWDWERLDSTIVGRALGRTIANGRQSHEFSIELNMHRDVAYAQVLPLLDGSAPEVRDAAAAACTPRTSGRRPGSVQAVRQQQPLLCSSAVV